MFQGDGDFGVVDWIQVGVGLLSFLFILWMLVEAIRRGDYLWALFIFISSGLSAVLYFFLVYRASGGGALTGFELPGAADRRRIKTLQAEIYHLDRAHHHLELADIYLSQGKLEQAEASYRAAFDRDAKDEDIRAHLGNCLARRGKPAEALPLLESVCATNPKHEYGYTLMTLAEAQTAAGLIDQAIATWQQVLTFYSYSRARVQYADLLIQKKDYAPARKLLQGVIDDAPHVPKFLRKREAIWFKRAKASMAKIPRE